MVWIRYNTQKGFINYQGADEPTIGFLEAKVQVEFPFIEGQPIIFFKYDGSNVVECSEDEIEIRELEIPPAETLEDFKAVKLAQIDVRTGQLIATGYSFGGFQFSLSANAQTNLIAIFMTKDFLTYPIRYNTKNDEEAFDIDSAATLTNLYFTALNTKKGFLDSGTVYKDAIRDATTIDEVKSVNDIR